MITHEHECETCGLKFEHRHPITDAPPDVCPECHGKIHQQISGGTGFIIGGDTENQFGRQSGNCSLKSSGQTRRGRTEHCANPFCEGHS